MYDGPNMSAPDALIMTVLNMGSDRISFHDKKLNMVQWKRGSWILTCELLIFLLFVNLDVFETNENIHVLRQDYIIQNITIACCICWLFKMTLYHYITTHHDRPSHHKDMYDDGSSDDYDDDCDDDVSSIDEDDTNNDYDQCDTEVPNVKGGRYTDTGSDSGDIRLQIIDRNRDDYTNYHRGTSSEFGNEGQSKVHGQGQSISRRSEGEEEKKVAKKENSGINSTIRVNSNAGGDERYSLKYFKT